MRANISSKASLSRMDSQSSIGSDISFTTKNITKGKLKTLKKKKKKQKNDY